MRRLWMLGRVLAKNRPQTGSQNSACLSSGVAASPFTPSCSNATPEEHDWTLTLTDKERAQLRLVQAEFEVFRTADVSMPGELREKDLRHLLTLDERIARIKFLWYLGEIQRAEQLELQKKEEKRAARVAKYGVRFGDKVIEYDIEQRTLWNNAIFRRIEAQTISKFHNTRIARAWTVPDHSPQIVLDFDFLPHLSALETHMTCKQLQYLMAFNKAHRIPARLHCTGVDFKANYFKVGMRGVISLLRNGTALLRNVENCSPAKQELRLDYRWQRGRKVLALNHCLGMLLDVHAHGDWTKAIVDNVPPRCLLEPTPEHVLVRARGAKNVLSPSLHRTRMQHFQSLMDLFE